MRLHLGRRSTGITLIPEATYPGMWRVRWPDGQVSPMANRTRCKEATIRFVRPRGLGSHEVASWHHRETMGETPPAAVLPEPVG